MAEQIASILEQARLLVLQHAPSDLLKEALPFGLICLVAGIGLSVFGAKMSRFGLTGFAMLLGAYVGGWVGHETGYPVPVCGGIAALLFAVIGHQTYKFWVGVMAALVLSSIALGIFGYQRVLPHMAEFQQTSTASSTVEGGFALPSPEEQASYRQRSPRQWAGELWSFVVQRDVRVAPNGKALAALALVTGLCLGIIAVRWAMILSTSLIGTSLVSTALATLMAENAPTSYQALQLRPGMAGIGVGAFLVTSIVLQTLLTRAGPKSKSEAPAKS